MANSQAIYEEIRIDLRNPELTECYILIRAEGDSPLGVQGWHHKTFASSKSAMDILHAWAKGEESPILWPLDAPRN